MEKSAQQCTFADVQELFNSYNAGYYACLFMLARFLIEEEEGIKKFGKLVADEHEAAADTRSRNDLYFLRSGFEGLDAGELDTAVTSARSLIPALKDAEQAREKNFESLDQTKQDWFNAATEAENQLRAWRKWAFGGKPEPTFINSRTVSRPGLTVSLRNIFIGNITFLSSPEQLQNNYSSFQRMVSEIDGVIDEAYFKNELPDSLEVQDFHAAIGLMKTAHEKFLTMSALEESASDDFYNLFESYQNRRDNVTHMLCTMPRKALWAIFLLVNPQLRNYQKA